MSFDTVSALIIASSELKVVRLLRDAINSGLPKTGPLGTIPPGANPATPRVRPKFSDEPRGDQVAGPGALVGSRSGVAPMPRFEPRTVIHPSPRFENLAPACLPPPADCVPDRPAPIPPVWATLPPVECDAVVVRPKVFVQKVDVITKGTLLDLFV